MIEDIIIGASIANFDVIYKEENLYPFPNNAENKFLFPMICDQFLVHMFSFI